ncbi:MAG: undecaprenyldiphospho-muramoylpentapeptide beta-N-acetylglucosaminyltransferase [Bacilli bacterium]|nr:undecaprenyldiphospho-muramoylpentapeptide beta-N-acetylglucosaminyltransferase [Bacilli bacterium]
MRVIVTAGGTGGHVYPALSVINKIKEMSPKSEILYIGTKDRMEATLIPSLNIPYVGIKMEGINRKKILNNIKVIEELSIACKEVENILTSFNPDIVIGFGGYVTFPVIYTAKRKGYKTFIHEQNSIPGLSNRFLSMYSDKIGVSLPGSFKYFPKKKTITTGNPRGEEAINVLPANKEDYHLTKDKKLVVIVMGSLGSKTINNLFKEIIPKFNNKNYEVIFITGKNYYDNYKNMEIPKNVKILPFVDNMLGLLKVTDLIVSRAGATIISEITSIKLPSILIPSPYVTNNHQYLNAKDLKEQGASTIIEEKNLNSNVLINTIDDILSNEKLSESMKEGCEKLRVTDSATRIYNCIKELVGGEDYE